MEIQSIFAWKSLPEAGFGKNVVIDAHRCSGSRIHLDHRSAGRSVIQDHSSDHRFKRLHLTRASVRRASGFVLTGKWEFIGSSIGLVPTNGLGGDRCDFIEADFLGPIYLRSAKLS